MVEDAERNSVHEWLGIVAKRRQIVRKVRTIAATVWLKVYNIIFVQLCPCMDGECASPALSRMATAAQQKSQIGFGNFKNKLFEK